MVSPAPRPARARSPEEKGQRRDDILRAAERLWTSTPYAELSMNQVAREAQLAKGTLYLYFDTKEELFLALLTEHLGRWLEQVTALLDERQPRTPEGAAEVLIQSARDQEPLRRLLILLGTVLERNVRPELALNFKREFRRMVQGVLERLPFAPEVTLRLLMHMYALSLGWQQLTEEPPAASLLRREADLAFLFPSFEQEFAFSLRAVIDRLVAEAPAAAEAPSRKSLA
ncbi:TetR/AcrR family transcriptional regulator [Deinococcus metallilatus]|uniref:AcrR family transcriptional regulator n=1 Tax=Deinococcus metallilatus TaxID=1211322 RepID=A0AAJ5K441_9DEIO|nr:TetR family transcriptional regulator [Deinococcus metallilatus]MBB5296667.1 AcrR family transcriptional regulator [Deinococcus metallilatus]QBY09247.1 TetR/AcrR family transcriptional regulator [Deinococcus metallilatus]RXJ09768.1 TetR/AcrR family transcriptional regulator [Deinococcus metallilatus]TLK24233.1 TetR/AcrR family transcriptional regulator [Deinococcus metallilatus]GMA13697.1 TetR family transcriptional regulator [Deinococcus metallilatus]